MRKFYPGITLFKLIGSLLVIVDHVRLPLIYLDFNNKITGLHRLMVVVPCFYIISGFLAYQGWSHAKNPNQYIRKYLTWILSLYLLFFVFYVVEHLIPQYFHYGFVPHLIKDQFFDILNKLFNTGPYPALWFIPPLFCGIVASYYFESRNKLKLGLQIVAGCFILVLLLNGTLRVMLESYFGKSTIWDIRSIKISVYMLTKYLANGLTFVFLGVLIGKYENQFLKIRAAYFILFTVLFVAAEMIYLNQAIGKRYPYLLTAGMIPITVLAFRGILRIKVDGIQANYKFINVFTIILYFCHINLMNITFYLMGVTAKTITLEQSLLCMGIIVSMCLAITAGTFYIQRNLNVPFKKILSRT